MADPFKCMVCEQTEDKCKCEKYCGMCQGEHQVRLCQDGLYYCLECREACDMQAQY
jgi:sulfur transfer complex TusBCD TusB component (DsrH family)